MRFDRNLAFTMPSLQAALIQCKVILINEKKHLKIWAVAILFIYWFIYAVNMSTYAWQTTTLSPFFPSVRDSCPMTYPDGKHCNIISTTSMLPKLNIAIVCLYGDPNKNKRSNNLWNQALYDRIFENRNAYAKRYGYTIIKTPFELIDKSRPIAWSKLLAINKYLPDYDYVFYLDMDTVILNMDVSLESIIGMGCKGSSRSSSSSSSSSSVANSDSKSTGSNGGIISKATRDDDYDRHHRFSFYSYKHVKPTSGIHTIRSNSHTQSYLVSDADIILTTDHNGPNTGSFLIRNSEFSQWLMNEVSSAMMVPINSEVDLYIDMDL